MSDGTFDTQDETRRENEMATERAVNDTLRGPIEHELKCWPLFYSSIESGKKSFELRKDDRDFQLFDTLWLREFCGEKKDYTGRECRREITYLLRGPCDWGLAEGYVILSLSPVLKLTPPTPDQEAYLRNIQEQTKRGIRPDHHGRRNDYAWEHCDGQRVAEARQRIYEHGTLAYIANVQQQNREALSAPSSPDSEGGSHGG